MRFDLSIRLGSSTMLLTSDVAAALRSAATNMLRACGERCEPYDHSSGQIRDANGNVVGEWSYAPGDDSDG